MRPVLLQRVEFQNLVLLRDKHTCIFCNCRENLDAHHIMERRLFPDGGYYLDNGATVCPVHHMMSETTEISVQNILGKTGINKRVTPPHLYHDQEYDKWANPILINGQRMKGELFFDASVQKALARGNMLGLFTDLVKYPRTFHLPWSEGATKDDRILESIAHFEGVRVVISEKMDGENTTMYPNAIHARSVDSNSHGSQSWVKNFHSGIKHDIPDGWRICGENCYAKHSIHYTCLDSYFYGFSIWNGNYCLSWAETSEWFSLIGIRPVPILFEGLFSEQAIQILRSQMDNDKTEGYIVRVEDGFESKDFSKSIAKFVRKEHIGDPSEHWRWGQKMVRNEIVT